MKTNRWVLRLMSIGLVWLLYDSAQANGIEGFTQPFETVELAAAEPGIIKTLDVAQGTSVVQGQVVATLDNGVLQASLASARAKAKSQGRVAAAEAASRQRDSRLAQMRTLQQDGHASSEELQRAETDAAIAKANLLTAREDAQASALEVKRIEAQIDRRTIRCPMRGVVTHVAKRPGELVTATNATVATIVRIDRLRVTFHVPTEQVASLQSADQVTVRFASDGREVVGRIEFISPITDAESNLVLVQTIVDNAQGDLRSGVRCSLVGPVAMTNDG